jgi:uncharacterized metal-binding protein YceD (DUF177 family)
MESLLPYNLPLGGLKDGIHRFQYTIDNEFFSAFESSPYSDGQLEVVLTLDKRPNLLELEFQITGVLEVECDRCSGMFGLPLEEDAHLLVKFDEEEREEEDVVYIQKGTQELNVAQYIYEFILLSVPMVKTHEDADEACDPDVMEYLEGEIESESDATEGSNPIWDELKKLSNEE